jgi:hypothetical protein
MKKISIVILTFAVSNLFSQPAVQPLNSYFTEIRSGKSPSIPKEVINTENAKTTLNTLTIYYRDTVSIIRSKAYSITRTIAVQSNQFSIRQESVQKLVNACRDRDSGNTGSVLGYLTEFKKQDFTPSTKDTLRALFKNRIAHLDQLIRLIGFLEINDLQSDLRTISAQVDGSKRDRWAAQLALARMGDKQIMQTIIDRVKKMQVNDELVYEVFPDLTYTRQMEAIGYLSRVLFSDENNCESADAERSAKIPCAYRVMEQLAPVIEGYPLKLDESGDVNTKDYVEALKSVREWFRQQKEYKINKDTY